MENLSAGDLKIEWVEDPDIRLIWRGKSNDRQPGKILQPFLRSALEHAASRKVAVELHLEGLEHFNSSTITALIQLIQEAKAKSVKLVLCFSGALKWQQLSFDALRVFAKGTDLLEFRAI